MKTDDKRNLIQSWPVYLLFVVLIAIMILFYHQNHFQALDKPLDQSIKKSFLGVKSDKFENIDDVINDRKSWHPILADWQGKPINDFFFSAADDSIHQLKDFSRQQTIVLIWASWYPACKMQLVHLSRAASLSQTPVSIIAVTAESRDAILEFPIADYPDILFATVTTLPQPFNLPASIPAIFFLDSNQNLKLAAEGLLTAPHIAAILDLSE